MFLKLTDEDGDTCMVNVVHIMCIDQAFQVSEDGGEVHSEPQKTRITLVGNLNFFVEENYLLVMSMMRRVTDIIDEKTVTVNND
jgi:hypothetical protein